MKKIYVLDTNVLLTDSQAILKFHEHIVVIPQPVISEIDKRKKDPGELGYNARQFSRLVDELRLKGNLTNGVPLNDEGGMFYVTIFDDNIAKFLPYQDMSIFDNRILASALYAKANFGLFLKDEEFDVTIISNDCNMRILADCFEINAEDYKNSKVQTDDLYTGIQHINVDQDIIDRIYTQEKLDLTDTKVNIPYPNECFVFHSSSNTKQSALTRYNSVMKEFRLLPQDMKTCDILPKNSEQQFSLDILKDEEIKLVTLEGLAGSGKTLMALTSAIHGVLETQKYEKILLLKSTTPMDNDHELGFLPGGLIEKLAPWMASYSDNISVIMSKYMKDEEPVKKKKSKKEDEVFNEKVQGKLNPMEELMSHGLLEVGSLEHIRGRSLPNQFIIIDEAQNLSKNSIRTIITRIGEGSKIVIMGDSSQIDSPWLDCRSNGLTIVIDAFKNEKISGHITMKKSERSELAELASKLL